MGRAIMPHRHIGLFPAALEFLEAQLFDHELHAGLGAILSIAQGIEHPDHGFDARNELVHRRKFPKDLRQPWGRPEPASCNHAEADRSIRALRGKQSDIVNRREGAVLLTAREGNFKFAGQTLIERIPQEMERNGFRIGRHVEYFPLADAGQVAGRHVADRIGAGLSGGQPDLSQATHNSRHILQLDKMQLDILARSHMPDACGIALGQFRHPAKLIGRHPAKRNLDADHLNPGLPLPVDTVLKTEGPE